jgi:hypothetical protein
MENGRLVQRHRDNKEFSSLETVSQYANACQCHAEQSEASRIFKVVQRRDSSAAPQNDITAHSLFTQFGKSPLAALFEREVCDALDFLVQ